MDWLADYVDWHRGRFDPFDWPAADTDDYFEMIVDWQEAFRGANVTEDEARRASRRLALAPPKYRREHLPALMQTVAAMRAGRAPVDGAAAATREAARDASKGCGHCGGEGLATVWHPHPDPARRVAPTCSAHCACPHGRFMRAKLVATPEGEHTVRRIPDLCLVLSGRTGWLLRPPGERPAAADSDADDHRRSVRALFGPGRAADAAAY